MIKQTTTNTFKDGMVMDFNPLNTPDDVVTNCLNGTLITFNGNEYVLLNDMGNGRVETACLPLGYIPLGTTQLGGIIYIVSYNPLIDKCQIGSFPSPERNITSDELQQAQTTLNCNNFYESNDTIVTNSTKILLTDRELYPGDKFCVTSPDLATEENKNIISALGSSTQDINDLPKYLKLYLVSIQDNGKIIYLKDLVWYENGYYINDKNINIDNGKLSLEEYRDVVQGNYSVFSPDSKIAGKLAIIAKLETVDTFSSSVRFKVEKNDENKQTAYIYLCLNWTYDNPNLESLSKVNIKSIKCIHNKEQKEETSLKLQNSEYQQLTHFDDVQAGKDPIYNDSTEKIKRLNDGTDPEYIKFYKAIEYDINKDEIVNLTILPGMDFGYLKYLLNNLTFNLKDIGSGITDLIEYRYFIENEELTLSYGFKSYPKENEEVKSVTFKFYPFTLETLDTYNWIKSNEQYIDNDYVVKTDLSTQWKNSKLTTSELNNSINYTFVNKSKSILGSFNKLIEFDDTENNGLLKNSIYLTEININYNNIEERKYYRILYTTPIFNSAYYNTDDFSTLELNDYIKISSKISNSNDLLVNSKQTFKDKVSNSLITNIPGYKFNTETCNYLVQDLFTNKIDKTISLFSNYDIFDLSVDAINSNNYTYNSTNNAQQKYILNGDADFSISNNVQSKETSVEINNGNIIYKSTFDNTITSPLKVSYNTQSEMPVQYALEPLNGKLLYINSRHSDKHMWIGLDEVRQLPENALAQYDTKDEGKVTFASIEQVTSIGSSLYDIIKNYDYIALCFNIFAAYQANRHLLQIWKNSDKYTMIQANDMGSESGKVPACFIVFIFKNDTGLMSIFYPKEYFGSETYKVNETTKYDWGSIQLIDREQNINKDQFAVSDLNGSQFTQDITELYSNYCKVVDYHGTGMNIYTYDNIIYWNNFTTTTKINLELDLNIKYKINNINIDTTVKNLNINTLNINVDQSFNINNQVQFDKAISLIMNVSYVNKYVYIGKNEINNNLFVLLNETPSTRTIYLKNNIDQYYPISYIGKNLQIINSSGVYVNQTGDVDTAQIWIESESEKQRIRIKNIRLWQKN